MAITRDIEQAIAAVPSLSRNELAARWERIYGCAPPKGMGRRVLELAAAWHLQRKAFGGLSPEARRLLNRAIREVEQQLRERHERRSNANNEPPVPEDDANDLSRAIDMSALPIGSSKSPSLGISPRPVQPLLAGARLFRQWNGRQHFVEVTDDGFVFEGKTYRSLSAIARSITGTQWSGPRFFGL